RKGNLKRCIYFSTVQVYGKAGNGIISEQTLPEPVNVYGITHYICEEICNFFTRTGRIECVNLRLANSYGQPVFKENNCWQLVINDLCRQAVETGRIVLLSDGSPQRDFIHYDDIVAAVNLFLMTECWGDKTYNLCSGQTYTILELAEIVKDCCKTKIGRDVTISSKSQFRNKADYSKSPSKTIWNNAALTSLGFKSVTQLHVGVDSMIDYLVQR
ncbi:MAG: SDR family oxidoreductase, partial [Sedimentisphaerales bacterium]|nr:SDR family oxidoreductase [Sedimentisphaerales bacterium]